MLKITSSFIKFLILSKATVCRAKFAYRQTVASIVSDVLEETF